MVVMKKQNIVITDQTGCKSSLISVYTPYIDRVNRVKKKIRLFLQKRSDLALLYLLRHDKVFKR